MSGLSSITSAAAMSDAAARHIARGEYSAALSYARRAIAIQSDYALAHCNAGVALNMLNLHDQAVEAFQRALECDPTKQLITLNMADSLMKMGRSADALASLHRAHLTIPEPVIKANLGSAYFGTGDFVRAEYYFKQAIEGDVWLAKAHSNLAICWLMQGRWRDGWPEYGWRFAADDVDVRETELRTWDGDAVASLLVLAEQGLGEEILWLSILPDLRARGIKVWWECDKRLHALIGRSFNPHPMLEHFLPRVGLISRIGAREVPDGCLVDAVTDAGDLGLLFRNTHDDFIGTPYLKAAPSRYLEPFDGITVGISWFSGNASFGPIKSWPLSEWEPILSVAGVRFVDLQYGDHGSDPRVLKVLGIDAKDDIDGLASLMSECDLILTISNTTAHLAGALGMPCWVMLPPGYGKFWYWGTGDRTPWYPSLTLFQNTAGWVDVVERARGALVLRASGPSIVLHR